MIECTLVSDGGQWRRWWYGAVGESARAWWAVPLPPCPNPVNQPTNQPTNQCGGMLVWAEEGQVPGTRRCSACQTMYRVVTVTCSCERGHDWCEECGDPIHYLSPNHFDEVMVDKHDGYTHLECWDEEGDSSDDSEIYEVNKR